MKKSFTKPADSFINNPAMNFISTESIEEQAAPTAEIPAGYKLVPIETKSQRVQLLMQPSTVNAIKAKAKAKNLSMNQLINQVLLEYIENN